MPVKVSMWSCGFGCMRRPLMHYDCEKWEPK